MFNPFKLRIHVFSAGNLEPRAAIFKPNLNSSIQFFLFRIRPAIPVGDVPDELRQNVQDGDEEVGDGEVVHEVVHPRRRLPAQLPPQRHQHDPVAEQGHQEDDGLQDGQRM